jgi:hypothetical protein
MTSAAVTLGIAILALVYALMRVDAARYIDCHARHPTEMWPGHVLTLVKDQAASVVPMRASWPRED